MPLAVVADHVFERYGWTFDEWWRTPEWLWDELLIKWKADGDAQKVKKAREPGSTEELIAAAMQEGFDLPPEVIERYRKQN